MHKFTTVWNFIFSNAAFHTAFIYFILLPIFHLFHYKNCNLGHRADPLRRTQTLDFNTGLLFDGFAVIKDWTLSAPYSHLAGGMKYKDGKLTVPIPGRYYIYEQIYWRGYRGKPARISILVNNKIIAMAQPPMNSLRRDEFTISTGGVFHLKAGDVITVAATQYAGIAYMHTYHSFFGAFLI